MSGCDRLSDRMPAVALGRTRWSGEEAAHLAGCADCRAEWELVRAAGRLGAELPVLNSAAITAGLRHRLDEPHRPAPSRRRLVWGAGLAAAGLSALVWAGAQRADDPPTGVATAHDVPAETLTTAQADSLLQSEQEPLAGWSMLESLTLGDLNVDELEQVLRTWEG